MARFELFLNDILFRPKDLTALLESRPEATFAAWTLPDGLTAIKKFGDKSECLNGDQQTAAPAAAGLPTSASVATAATFDMACATKFYTHFYDTSVARDRRNDPMSFLMSYSYDRATRDALRRIVGAHGEGKDAVAVKLGWGGVSAIQGSLFLPVAFPAGEAASSDREKRGAKVLGRAARNRGYVAVTKEDPVTAMAVVSNELVAIPGAESEIMVRGLLRRLLILHHYSMGFMYTSKKNYCRGKEAQVRVCYPTAGTNSTDALVQKLHLRSRATTWLLQIRL